MFLNLKYISHFTAVDAFYSAQCFDVFDRFRLKKEQTSIPNSLLKNQLPHSDYSPDMTQWAVEVTNKLITHFYC